MHVTPQVNSNGFISFSSLVIAYTPRAFPLFVQVVAPYWDDIDTRMKGFVRYAVITKGNHNLSCLLELTNDFIRSREDVDFEASWVLVARWVDVCPYGDNNCTMVNEIALKYS